MVCTRYQIIVVFIFVLSGSLNTILAKFANRQVVECQDGEERHFNHPYMQSLFMFIGEIYCFILFKILFCHYSRKMDDSVDTNKLTKGSRDFNQLVLVIPSLCDLIASCLLYVGLTLTYASSLQMLRGTVIVFTAALSTMFLAKRYDCREWSAISIIIVGTVLVGLSDFFNTDIEENFTANAIVIGDGLVVCSQFVSAVQMVLEEVYVSGLDIPALQGAGWEGIFGFIQLCLIMIPLNFVYVPKPWADNSRGTMEDTVDAFVQIGNSWPLLSSIVGITFNMAFFNFSGVSVTKEISATTRMVLDSLRTAVIWIFSLLVKWQSFHYLQPCGFFFIILGMYMYNNVDVRQCCCRSDEEQNAVAEGDNTESQEQRGEPDGVTQELKK